MPTIAWRGPCRFYFFSNEMSEPAHVHVRREAREAKFWLRPVSLARSTGFGSAELTRLERIVREERTRFMEAWNEFFDDAR